ncbi:Hypothetical protein CINCED_3A019743 [Cinara cedri]|uniref:Uncharacterized protein n=1 Tax=Cinara cedri TaxID=506608 RepID=A0A5E4N9D7_9HEMI|nr:Hypothetical protein CINCED_3A019743 [Cinara cedri]
MVKIGVSWLLLALMKLTYQEIKGHEIVSFQEVYDICQIEPSIDICDLLEKSSGLVDINKLDLPEKRRQTPIFNSWGGKRQSTYPYGGKRPAFSSWGGKRTSDKRSRPKQTFSSWGGKRNEIDSYDDNGEMAEHQMEKRELNNVKEEEKKNYKNKMTKGIHTLFTIFSDWSRDPEEKKGIRYAGLKSMRRSSVFFPWGGKRSGGNSD